MSSNSVSSSRFHPYTVSSDAKTRTIPTRHHSSVKRSSQSKTVCSSKTTERTRRSGKVISEASRIGKYVLLDKAGSSSLRRAVNSETKQEFACRIVEVNKYRDYVSPYYCMDPHDHVNKVVEVLLGDSYAYVIFEPSYGDLHSYVRTKRRLKEEEACNLFGQIVSAVQHCHESGLVLRDLKLRKFVFDNKERTSLKLETLDDAYVMTPDSEDIITDRHGCPAYVSPEILESTDGYSGKAADAWSLGVMLFTMLIGRYPFHDSEPNALFSKIRSGHFTLPDSVSSRAKCLLRSVLRKDPSERLNAQEILEHPWFQQNFYLSSPTRSERKAYDQQVPDLGCETMF